MTNHYQLGRLAAELNQTQALDPENLTGNLMENSQIVTGYVDQLLSQGRWERAVETLYGRDSETPRMLFQDSEGTLSQRILQKVNGDQFQFDSPRKRFDFPDEITQLSDHSPQTVHDIVVRTEGIPYQVREYILRTVREKLGEEVVNTSLQHLATGIEDSHPIDAARIYADVGHNEGLDSLYQTQLANLTTDTAHTAFEVARARGSLTKATKEILKLKGIETCEGLGVKLFKALRDRDMDNHHLEESERDAIYALFTLQRDYPPIRSSDTPPGFGSDQQRFRKVQLLWAKQHWQDKPLEAYKIFRTGFSAYDGEEVIPCALKAFLLMYGDDVEFNEARNHNRQNNPISEGHKRAFYAQIPSDNLAARVEAVQAIEDEKKMLAECLSLSTAYFARGNLERTYRLRFASKTPPDDQFREDVVIPLIRKDIEGAFENNSEPHLFWLYTADSRSFQLAFEAVVDTWPQKALQLANRANDQERIETARSTILEQSTPIQALWTFRDVKDQEGFDRAMATLAESKGLTPQDASTYLEGLGYKIDE